MCIRDRIKVGRMTDSMKKQLLVENYKLSGRDVLEQVGNSRGATEEDIKQWNNAGLPIPDMEEANKPTAQEASPAPAQQTRSNVAPALTLEGQTLTEVNAQEKKRQADEAAAQRDDAPKGQMCIRDRMGRSHRKGKA